MSAIRRTFSDLSFGEKLTIIDDYLDSIGQTDHHEMLAERMEWLRRHIPAYNGTDGENYTFISYSHKDFRLVYNDLAFFSYNGQKKVRFWYDEGLPAGDDWFKVAKERLSDPHCVGVIFYLSDNFLRSSAVLQEIELVKSLKKPYFTISLEPNKFCARDYLDPVKDAELLAIVDPVFSRDDTSVSYGTNMDSLLPEHQDGQIGTEYDDSYEHALYRIRKIEQAFSVVEELYSDFVFEQVEDGLCLTEYRGYETEIHIPARIAKHPVTEIKAHFDNATEIFIPYTVKRITPVEVAGDLDGFDPEDQNTWSVESIYLMQIGGYKAPGALFGRAQNLTQIHVDAQNPVFYDVEGILYSKPGTLVRVPANHEWDDQYAKGITTIGFGAFYGYDNTDANISLPETVTHIEANAFAYANIFYISMDSVKEIGDSAFSHCSLAQGMLPLSLPSALEKMGEFTLSHTNAAFISFPDSPIEEIPRGAFFGHDGDFLEIPRSVKLIQAGAFALCSNLETLILHEGLLGIADYAFAECKKLYSITLPRSVAYLSPFTFDTENILRYIFYKGTSRDQYYLRQISDIEDADYLPLLINKDQWLERLAAHTAVFVRNKAIKILEKLQTPSGDSTKRRIFKGLFKGITFPMMLAYLLSTALLFFADYRRLVLEIAPDWLYWLSCGAGFVLSYTGSRHMYWAKIVGRHKKDAQNKAKPKKSFFDAWTSVLAIGLLVYGLLSLLITILISGIYDLGVIANLFAGFGG